jgi:hypothetical protein
MATISIPEKVYPGLRIISELDDIEINKVIQFLNSLNVGENIETFANELNDLVGEDKGDFLLQAILSFSRLIEYDEVNLQDVANNLTFSYFELTNIKSTKLKAKKLTDNLIKIFSNYSSLKLSINSRRNSLYNENNLGKSKMLTDVRLVFDDELNNKKRIGIILHKLYLEYQRNGEIQELHLTMDMKDLKKLKNQIEESILKDELIRNDYKENLNFIL